MTRFLKPMMGTPFAETIAEAVEVRPIAEIASIDGSLWQLCLHPFEYKRSLNPDLEALANDDSGRNIFYHPAFLAAGRGRILHSPFSMLIIWHTEAGVRQPKFSLPVTEVQKGLLNYRHLDASNTDYGPLGDPLIDFHQPELVLEKITELLKIAFAEGLPPIMIRNLSSKSLIWPMVQTDIRAPGFSTSLTKTGSRSCLNAEDPNGQHSVASSKRRREINRLQRKLGIKGKITFERVSEAHDILLRFEEFLLIESKTWKGRRGTSMYNLKRTAAFARQTVTDMSREGHCEIFSLRVEDKAVSMVVVFNVNGYYYPWKTTYDEKLAAFSPGSILMYHLTQELLARKDFVFADSLARLGRSWMHLFWPASVQIGTLVLSSDPLHGHKLQKLKLFQKSFRKVIKKLFAR